jgi:hypothetical protein
MINGLPGGFTGHGVSFALALTVLVHSKSAWHLIVHPDTQSVLIQVGETNGAKGMAVSATRLLIQEELLDEPARLALVIVHELTHCLDYRIVGPTLREDGNTWASELNAHGNQGLVMRELKQTMPRDHVLRSAFDAMERSNTTFGQSTEWDTRRKVADGIKPVYGKHRATNSLQSSVLYDLSWKKNGTELEYFPSPTAPAY